MKAQIQSPEQAFNQSREMFRKLTGRGSPDILFVASCMWCVCFAITLHAHLGPQKVCIALLPRREGVHMSVPWQYGCTSAAAAAHGCLVDRLS